MHRRVVEHRQATLRATASDNRGNTVEQTIVNAYRFGRTR